MGIDVAATVQNFYDRYPYPPPASDLERYQRAWQHPQRRRAEHHLLWPSRPYREDHAILVAGCGTSQAAKHALRWPAAQVTAIDVSATSVRCTEELRRRHGLNNLQVRQLPVERARELGTAFDHIVCTGVLHHLADPDAGLAALHDVLAQDGAMHLMVYAPYGRTGVYIVQEFCRRLGIEATDDGIRELAEMLRALPPGHPLARLLREAPDFRNEAALADALLHPKDRAYSVPQLFQLIADAGLTFGRWVKQAPYSPHCGVLSRIPQAPRLKDLSLAEQYAAAELFRGTMVRHSLIAYKRDPSSTNDRVSFSDETWLDYVPLRRPDTVCVQERVLSGATAVLINRSHTDRDLILALNACEKRLFDAIDGSRTVRDVVKSASASSDRALQPDAVRALFQQLWWYDHVVFDAS
jgi:SAM-dependent methyltransferase